MAPFSRDLRLRLVKAYEEGASARQVAERFEVSLSAVVKLMQRVRATGSIEPTRIGGYRKPLLADHATSLRDLVATWKGITLAELQHEIVERGGPKVSLQTVWSMLRRLGLTHKKSR